MTPPSDDLLSVQVLLSDPDDHEAYRRLRAHFERHDLEVGDLVFGSFPVSGPLERIEAALDCRIHRDETGVTFDPSGRRLLAGLPASLRPLVRDILVTPPPAFGPGNY